MATHLNLQDLAQELAILRDAPRRRTLIELKNCAQCDNLHQTKFDPYFCSETCARFWLLHAIKEKYTLGEDQLKRETDKLTAAYYRMIRHGYHSW